MPLDKDPKMAWALLHPECFPVEANKAGLKELLRVPGIGHKSAQRIVDLRKEAKLQDLRKLRRFGVVASRAAPFILLDGRRPPKDDWPGQREQLTLWNDFADAG